MSTGMEVEGLGVRSLPPLWAVCTGLKGLGQLHPQSPPQTMETCPLPNHPTSGPHGIHLSRASLQGGPAPGTVHPFSKPGRALRLSAMKSAGWSSSQALALSGLASDRGRLDSLGSWGGAAGLCHQRQGHCATTARVWSMLLTWLTLGTGSGPDADRRPTALFPGDVARRSGPSPAVQSLSSASPGLHPNHLGWGRVCVPASQPARWGRRGTLGPFFHYSL